MANVISVTNPVFATEDGLLIDCLLGLDVFPAPVPFTANANDVEAHGRQIYADLMAGAYGPIAAYVAPPEPVVEASVAAPISETSAPTVL